MKIKFRIRFGVLIAAIVIYIFVRAFKPEGLEEVKSLDEAHNTPLKQETNSLEGEKTPELNPYDRPDPDDPRLKRLASGKVLYNPSIKTSRSLSNTLDPKDALETVSALLTHYRFAYKENPVGVENFEFTEQLLGQNPMSIVFIDPESSSLKGNELVDAWGTPYFFHPLSATEMEIYSAGPDKTLWTADDIAHSN